MQILHNNIILELEGYHLQPCRKELDNKNNALCSAAKEFCRIAEGAFMVEFGPKWTAPAVFEQRRT